MRDQDTLRHQLVPLVRRSLDGTAGWHDVRGLCAYARRPLRAVEVEPVRSALRTVAATPGHSGRIEALLGLSWIWRPEDVPLAHAIATDPDETPRTRARAVVALTRTPDLDAMLTTVTDILLADTAPKVHADGLRGLRDRLDRERQHGDDATIGAFVERVGTLAEDLLSRPDRACLAVGLLDAVRHPRTPHVAVSLAAHPSSAVRLKTLWAISRYPELDTISLARTREPDPRIRAVATGNLRALSGAEVVDRLEELLDDESPFVRRHAYEALFAHPDEAERRLMAGMHARHGNVSFAFLRWAAEEAPNDHTETIATLLRDPSDYTRWLAMEFIMRSMRRYGTMIEAGSPLLAELVRLLEEPDSPDNVADMAATLLLDRTTRETRAEGDSDLVAALTAILDRYPNTPSRRVRAALRLLGMFGDATALPAVERWQPGEEPSHLPSCSAWGAVVEPEQCRAEHVAVLTRLHGSAGGSGSGEFSQ
jgi:hypothetical protein